MRSRYTVNVMNETGQSGAEADAAHAMAIRAAEGTGQPQDWTAALDHLQRSAHLGSRLAQAELAALSGQWALAHDLLAGEAVEYSRWSQLRDSIDLAAWLQPARASTISDSPRLAVVRDFIGPEICDWLIARARPRLRPAQIYDEKEGQHRPSSGRTNSYFPFLPPERDLILATVRARIAEVTGLQVQAMESPHLLHYSVGEAFAPHFDTTENPSSPGFRPRVLTFLTSLNDDYEGGETEFPVIDGRWKGRRGSALFFWNVKADGGLDRSTLHAGLPVVRGEKWLLSQWIEVADGQFA